MQEMRKRSHFCTEIKSQFNFLCHPVCGRWWSVFFDTAHELLKNQLKSYLWVIVISYYSMFYMANALLLQYGYKTQDKIAHKVTSDALIVLVLDKLRKELLDDYEAIQKDALEIASAKAESVIESYSLELDKRSTFQYNMLEQTKESKARTSLKRASEFVFELKKLLKEK